MKTLHFPSKKEWLDWRVPRPADFFGASSASVCAGNNPYKTQMEEYMERVGLKERQDISDKERVRYGTEAEDPIRKLFALDYADRLNITTAPWDILLDDRYPFIGATLDGYMEYTSSDLWKLVSPTGFIGTIYKGDRGVYEGKTALVRGNEPFDSWKQQCPDWYLAQGCQQLYVCREWARFWFVNSMVERPRFIKTNDGFEQTQFNEQMIVRHVYFIDDPIVRQSINFVISKVVEMKRRVDLKIPPDTKIF